MSKERPDEERINCDDCLEHKALVEKIQNLNDAVKEREDLVKTIPGLLDFKSMLKGGIVVIAACSIFFGGVIITMVKSADANMEKKQASHEQQMKENNAAVVSGVNSMKASQEKWQDSTEKLIKEIVASSQEMREGVAVIKNSLELEFKEAEKERQENRRRIEALEKALLKNHGTD